MSEQTVTPPFVTGTQAGYGSSTSGQSVNVNAQEGLSNVIQKASDQSWNPFDSWGHEGSNWGKGIQTFLSLAKDVAAIPLVPLALYGKVQATLLDRPISTALQALTPDSELYRDGFQWGDITRMWNASEADMGIGRSLAYFTGGVGRMAPWQHTDNPGTMTQANYLSPGVFMDPNVNPYSMTDQIGRAHV
jgi:hypothetical protein